MNCSHCGYQVPPLDKTCPRCKRPVLSAAVTSLSHELIESSVRWVVVSGQCTTSGLQRKFQIGYTTASLIIEELGRLGVVGPQVGVMPREVRMKPDQVEGFIARLRQKTSQHGPAQSIANTDEQTPIVPSDVYDELHQLLRHSTEIIVTSALNPAHSRLEIAISTVGADVPITARLRVLFANYCHNGFRDWMYDFQQDHARTLIEMETFIDQDYLFAMSVKCLDGDGSEGSKQSEAHGVHFVEASGNCIQSLITTLRCLCRPCIVSHRTNSGRIYRILEDIEAETTPNTGSASPSLQPEPGRPSTQAKPPVEALTSLIGLGRVKTELHQLIRFLQVQQLRKSKGLAVPNQSLHMVFSGNPGTGKTTVARLVGQIYKSLGLLSKGHFVETDRSGLVAGYLGQTALKVQSVVDSARGGVLFIDEAYSLTANEVGRDEFGHEAVNTILKLMEDHRDDLVVIVAGYTERMQRFVTSNPGLESRFNRFLQFEDYSPQELVDIFTSFATQGDYVLTDDAIAALHGHFMLLHECRDESFGNARLARNLFEQAVNRHANRIALDLAISDDDLITLMTEDVVIAV